MIHTARGGGVRRQVELAHRDVQARQAAGDDCALSVAVASDSVPLAKNITVALVFGGVGERAGAFAGRKRLVAGGALAVGCPAAAQTVAKRLRGTGATANLAGLSCSGADLAGAGIPDALGGEVGAAGAGSEAFARQDTDIPTRAPHAILIVARRLGRVAFSADLVALAGDRAPIAEREETALSLVGDSSAKLVAASRRGGTPSAHLVSVASGVGSESVAVGSAVLRSHIPHAQRVQVAARGRLVSVVAGRLASSGVLVRGRSPCAE